MRSLSRLLAADRITQVTGQAPREVLKQLAAHYAKLENSIPEEDALKALIAREDLNSTAIGDGLAIPHARLHNLDHFSMILAIHKEGVPFDAFDEKPVYIFAFIMGPASANDLYVQILGRISRFLRDKKDMILASCDDPEEIYEMTLEY